VARLLRANRKALALGALIAVGLGSAAFADDTVAYKYDALGRVIEADYTGGPRDGQTVAYTYDPAGNRTQLVTTGGPPPPITGVVVLPLLGFLVIPLGP
jgi:hypothetical protein